MPSDVTTFSLLTTPTAGPPGSSYRAETPAGHFRAQEFYSPNSLRVPEGNTKCQLDLAVGLPSPVTRPHFRSCRRIKQEAAINHQQLDRNVTTSRVGSPPAEATRPASAAATLASGIPAVASPDQPSEWVQESEAHCWCFRTARSSAPLHGPTYCGTVAFTKWL